MELGGPTPHGRYRTAFGGSTPVAYQTLLLDAMRADPTLFTRGDEIESEWSIITSIGGGVGAVAGAGFSELPRRQ